MNSSVVRVEVGSKDVDNIATPLGPGITVRGRVQLEGSSVPLQFDSSLVIPQFTGGLGRGELFSGRISSNGSFLADGGFTGKFQVSVVGLPEGYYLNQVLQGPKYVLESGRTRWR